MGVMEKLFPPEQAPDGNNYSWKRRRRYMCAVTAFTMGVIVWILWSGRDTRVAETAMTMSWLCLIGIVGAYVFGAAWQDISHMNLQRGMGASPYGGGYGGGYGAGYAGNPRSPGMVHPGARTGEVSRDGE